MLVAVGDERLRELDRRWTATRDPGDEALLLGERLRMHRLERARLELAAYAGHGPAIEAIGAGAPIGLYVPWGAWRRCLDELARAPLVRLVLAHALDDLRRDPDPRPEVEGAVVALRGWLDCPCEAHMETTRVTGEPLGHPPGVGPQQVHGAAALAFAVSVIGAPLGPRQQDELGWALTWLMRQEPEPWSELLEALDELVRWALGPAHGLVHVPPRQDLPAYLDARRKRGELTRERLEVAAYAGSADARALLEHPPERPADLVEWVLGLGRWGSSWPLRALARLASDSAFVHGPPWVKDPYERPGGPVATDMPLLSDQERRSRSRSCASLRDWADTARPDLGRSLSDVHHFDDAPSRSGSEAQLALRATLIDVLETCSRRAAPTPSLVRRVVEGCLGRRRRGPPGIEEAVQRWALQVGGRSDAAWGAAPVSAPETP